MHLSFLQLNPHLEASFSSRASQRGMMVPRQTAPALAATAIGISSFAFQGTNAHAILQQATALVPSAPAASNSASVWQKRHFSVLPPMHACLHAATTATKGCLCVYEWPLHQPSSAFLMDHMVHGRAVMPAAAYLELFTAAAAATTAAAPGYTDSTDRLALLGAVFEAPLLLDTGNSQHGLTLRCSLDTAQGLCKLTSVLNKQVTQHMHGRIQAPQSHGLPGQARHLPKHSAMVRLMSSVVTNNVEDSPAVSNALASLTLTPSLTDGFYIHPSAMDNSLQLAGAAAQSSLAHTAAASHGQQGKIYIPASLQAFITSGRLPVDSTYATASLQAVSQDAHDCIVCDHSLVASDKQMLQLQGMTSRALQLAAAPQVDAAKDVIAVQQMPQMLYTLSWQANNAAPVPPEAGNGRMVALRSSKGKQAHATALHLAALMQAVSSGKHTRMRLQMQTHGSRSPVTSATAGTRSEQAALWGMLRTFQQECPQMGLTGADIAASTPSAAVASDAQLHFETGAAASVRAADGYGRSATGGAEYVARLLPVAPAGTTASDAQSGFPDLAGGSVTITGGTGMIGCLTAGWILEQARPQSIQLLSRTGRARSDRLQAILNTTAAQKGPMISLTMCDVSFTEDSAHCFGSSQSGTALEHRQATLGALVHAGGVLADATVGNQTPRAMRAVFAPKVTAAQHMQHVLRSQPVKTQVMFSSVAALLGAPGQLNYAAANAAMDCMAAQWQAQGQGGVSSIQWGGWAGGGMAGEDPSTASRLARMGMPLITPHQGLAAMQAVLSSYSTHSMPVISAIPFQWTAFMQQLPAEQPGMFAEFSNGPANHPRLSGPPHSHTATHKTASAKPASSASVKVLQQVTSAVTASLGKTVAPDASLMEAGLDSLSQVELRNTLSQVFEVELPATFTFDYPNAAAMAKHIATLLGTTDQVTDVIPDPYTQAAATHSASSERSPVQLAAQPARPPLPAAASAHAAQLAHSTTAASQHVSLPHHAAAVSAEAQQSSTDARTTASSSIMQQVQTAVASVLGASIAVDASLMEAGLDSLSAVELRNALSQTFELELPVTFTFDYPNIRAMASYISAAAGSSNADQGKEEVEEEVQHAAATPQLQVQPSISSTASDSRGRQRAHAITGVSLRWASMRYGIGALVAVRSVYHAQFT